jgi:hypothetical protein
MNNLHRFADNLADTVTKTLSDMHESRKRKAKNAAAERCAFVNNLKHKVKDFRNDFANELKSARRGWLGINTSVMAVKPIITTSVTSANYMPPEPIMKEKTKRKD